MSQFEAVGQDANIQGPRRGQGVALTVDTTARVYDLTVLAWNGQAFAGMTDVFLYLDFQNDGANPIYYYFGSDNTNDLNEATVHAADGSVLALVNAVPKVLRAAQDTPIRIQCDIDKFLVVKATTGSSVLRIFPSSNSTPKAQ